MKDVKRFLNDWRVDVKVIKLQPHVDLDSNYSYRIKATWSKSDEVIFLAEKALLEAAKYHNIRHTLKDLYYTTGRLYFDVSSKVLKDLGYEEV